MAFKQTLGRAAFPKTGKGMPPTLMSGYGSPAKQTDPKRRMTKAEAGKELENISEENMRKVAAEATAKADSTSAAKAALILGKSKKMASREGNKAANVTRANQGLPKVLQGRFTSGRTDKSGNYLDSYWRDNQLEKDAKSSTLKAYRQ